MDENTLKRFWSKVNKAGPVPAHAPHLGECWVWLAHKNPKRYGAFLLLGRAEQAHRVAFLIARGRWPEPFCLHHCDNPSCVRDSHLFEGTNADNVGDRQRKGRSGGGHNGGTARGTQVGLAKLTDDDVRKIRAMRADGMTLVAIGAAFGVSHQTARRVALRIGWRHVD